MILQLLLSLCLSLYCFAENYDGLESFARISRVDLTWLKSYFPENPVIVEAGAFYGNETVRAARNWPKGRVITFEPNPYAFEKLLKTLQDENVYNVEPHCLGLNTFNGNDLLYISRGWTGKDFAYEYASSVLPVTPEMQGFARGPQIVIPCVNLDTWCLKNQIDRIDLLKLELEGLELAVLKSSPRILSTAQVIYIKTFINPHREGMTEYSELKKFLEEEQFKLVAHWYTLHVEGYAIFVREELFSCLSF
jgi:FkbM family methyltransferase